MTTWRVTYGQPFPGWRDFTDYNQAVDFASTAVADDKPTITQLLDSTEEPTP